jgi:hypothetical protein
MMVSNFHLELLLRPECPLWVAQQRHPKVEALMCDGDLLGATIPKA